MYGDITQSKEKEKDATDEIEKDTCKTGTVYDMTHADEVIRPVKDGIVPTLNARMGTGGNQVPIIHTNGCVRKLTPLECERLQGLPDNWTLIEDKSYSDSARYKAIGNGMAQPCADFVMKNIKKWSI